MVGDGVCVGLDKAEEAWNRLRSVQICWGLVVELIDTLEGDLRVVGDDFILTWVLEKKNIIQPDSGQILETHAGLFGPGGWEI